MCGKVHSIRGLSFGVRHHVAFPRRFFFPKIRLVNFVIMYARGEEQSKMNFPEFCRKCGSMIACKTKLGSITGQLLTVIGYQSLCCSNCGFFWNKFSLTQIIWNMIHLCIAMGIGFVLWGFIR